MGKNGKLAYFWRVGKTKLWWDIGKNGLSQINTYGLDTKFYHVLIEITTESQPFEPYSRESKLTAVQRKWDVPTEGFPKNFAKRTVYELTKQLNKDALSNRRIILLYIRNVSEIAARLFQISGSWAVQNYKRVRVETKRTTQNWRKKNRRT